MIPAEIAQIERKTEQLVERILVALTVAIASVFAAFGLHVFQGGAFEMRTVGAMTLRLVVWIVISVVAVKNSSRGDPSRIGPR